MIYVRSSDPLENLRVDIFLDKLKSLGVPSATRNRLVRAGITDFSWFDGKSEYDLMRIRGLGSKSIDIVIEALQKAGFTIIRDTNVSRFHPSFMIIFNSVESVTAE